MSSGKEAGRREQKKKTGAVKAKRQLLEAEGGRAMLKSSAREKRSTSRLH